MASTIQYSLRGSISKRENLNILSKVQSFNIINASCFSRKVAVTTTTTTITSVNAFPNKLSPISLPRKHLHVAAADGGIYRWRVGCGGCAPGDYESSLDPMGTDANQLIIRFLLAITNPEDEPQFDKILADDCVLEDTVFGSKFEGKKEVSKFLCKIRDAMKPNIKVETYESKSDDSQPMFIPWYLEWKNKRIPFTSVCTSIRCEMVNGKLSIRQIMTGGILPYENIPKLLEAASTIFELCPDRAEEVLAILNNK